MFQGLHKIASHSEIVGAGISTLMAVLRSSIVLALALLSSASAFAFTSRSGAAWRGARGARRAATTTMMGARKDSYDVTLLKGDGIGPEISAATISVLDALTARFNFKLAYNDALIGGAAVDATGEPFPDASLEACRASDAILLACIGGPKWDGLPREQRPESGLLRMRKELGLFANLRPAVVLPQLVAASTLKPEIVSGVDVMVVREVRGAAAIARTTCAAAPGARAGTWRPDARRRRHRRPRRRARRRV